MRQQNGTNKREIKRKHAIKAWKTTGGNVTRICQKIGINRKTFYSWLKDDDFTYAIQEQEFSLNDEIRSKLIKQALRGNLRAIIHFLKHKHPEFSSKFVQISNKPKYL